MFGNVSRNQKSVLTFLLLAALIALVIVILFPIYWTFISSFKSEVEMFKIPPTWFPEHLSPENYTDILKGTFPQNLFNSLRISLAVTIISILIGAPAAYAFGNYQFRISGILFFLILIVRMFPPTSFLIPFYIMFQAIGLYDTWLVVVITHLTFQLPFVTWILTGFFSNIPKELEEAARIDGCSRVKAFIHIIFPLIGPGVSVSAFFAFIFSWNEFPYALVLTRTSSSKTAIVKLTETITSYQIYWGQMTAQATLLTLPVLVLVFLLQKYLVNAMVSGAVKG